MCLANTYLLHSKLNTHTHTQTFIHACTLKPACPRTCKQAKKSPLHTHTHACYIHCAGTHAQQGSVGEKKKEKAKVGCDWRVHCSDKTNLHTLRLRSEYAWGNKTICLEADHPLSLDYCTHLRAFYLLVGMQSSRFSVQWLMVSHNGLDFKRR